MKAMELFAGYGGLALATEAVFGAETPLVAEWEDSPSAILKARFPGAENLRDVTTVDWPSLSRFHLGVIGGGSPCQDVSGAGPRHGMHEGTRSGLWSSMRDAIATLEPEWVVWENVRGALSARATSLTPELEDEAEAKKAPRLRALGRVLGDLVSLGYDVQWRGVKASDVGAPHQRFRVFVLARKRTSLTSTPPPSGAPFAIWRRSRDLWENMDPYLDEEANVFTKVFPTDGFVSAGIAYALPKWTAEDRPLTLPTPRATRGGSATETTYLLEKEGVVDTLPTPTSSEMNGVGGTGTRGRNLRTMIHTLPTPDAYAGSRGGTQDPEKRRAGGHSVTLGDVAEWKLLPTPEASDSTGARVASVMGGTRPSGAKRSVTIGTAVHHGTETDGERTDWGKYAAAVERWEAVLGRPAPAPTEAGPKGGQRLSPRFVEWMMGLPDGWVTDPELGLSRSAQLKALGNGVVPAQAAAALRDMKARFERSH